jgi:hypothetical protein
MSSFYHSRPHFKVAINQYRQIEEASPLLEHQVEEKPSTSASTLDEKRPARVSDEKPSVAGDHRDNFLWMILRALEDRMLESFGLRRSDIRED